MLEYEVVHVVRLDLDLGRVLPEHMTAWPKDPAQPAVLPDQRTLVVGELDTDRLLGDLGVVDQHIEQLVLELANQPVNDLDTVGTEVSAGHDVGTRCQESLEVAVAEPQADFMLTDTKLVKHGLCSF